MSAHWHRHDTTAYLDELRSRRRLLPQSRLHVAGQGGVDRTGLLWDGIYPVEHTIYVLIVCVFKCMGPWVALDSVSRLMTWHASVCTGQVENGGGVLGSLWVLAQHC